MRQIYQPVRPVSWPERREHCSHAWSVPLVKLEWYCEWAAWILGNWALLEVVEYLGTFSLIVAVVFYFAGAGDRTRQKHYAAWAVINSAQGKGGSGGRIEALQELNKDRVALTGLDGSMAFLQGVQLPNARLSRCSFQAADLRQSVLRSANLTFCNLRSANFRNADLTRAQLMDADLTDADLNGADLSSSGLDRADLSNVDLRSANLSGVSWSDISSMRLANIFGVKNAPDGFMQLALAHGAVAAESDEEWARLQAVAKH
ncbi:MAG TPA: pentapeptide repeat-containing protein [Silvibacterium sp.]|nr:pentapeptide repeat-containing protein [Silvibacterium sp.]